MGFENSGRKPKPTALKVLQGNPGRRKLNIHEPKPPQGEVKQPEAISNAAAIVWDELAPIVLAMGTLTTVDVAAFTALCELESTRRQASAQKDAPGFGMFTISDDYNGAPKVGVHAAIKIERETSNALRPYYEYFGMTPSSRARLVVKQQKDAPKSKWEGALA